MRTNNGQISILRSTVVFWYILLYMKLQDFFLAFGCGSCVLSDVTGGYYVFKDVKGRHYGEVTYNDKRRPAN